MPPNLRFGEPGVAKRVIPVPVGVDHPSDRKRGQSAQLLPQLVGLDVRGTGVDDQYPLLSEHHADVQVERFVAPPEYSVGQLFEHQTV